MAFLSANTVSEVVFRIWIELDDFCVLVVVQEELNLFLLELGRLRVLPPCCRASYESEALSEDVEDDHATDKSSHIIHFKL